MTNERNIATVWQYYCKNKKTVGSCYSSDNSLASESIRPRNVTQLQHVRSPLRHARADEFRRRPVCCVWPWQRSNDAFFLYQLSSCGVDGTSSWPAIIALNRCRPQSSRQRFSTIARSYTTSLHLLFINHYYYYSFIIHSPVTGRKHEYHIHP